MAENIKEGGRIGKKVLIQEHIYRESFLLGRAGNSE
jgi:hypothetical protein